MKAAENLGDWLFRFAVMGDSHLEPETANGGRRPRSNARFAACIAAVNAGRPDFVLHLGDVVHPLPELEEYKPAIEAAETLLGDIDRAVHYTPGNHDVGDKPQKQVPAAAVRKDWVSRFEDKFGPQWQCFDHQDCRFILFNSLIVNSGWDEEEAQFEWLAQVLADAPGRVFIATHYPVFLRAADEPSYYDNIDEPGRSRLLNLVSGAGVEAVFTGHVHIWTHNHSGGTDLYGTPATGFVRRDFSEMFRVGPLAEFGREDPEKLGFLWVDVHENGHVCRMAHALEESRALTGDALPPAARSGQWSGLGVDLRHPWAEQVDLPFNPPVDAFVRKRVRNDYPALALIELGLRDLRVPVADFLDEAVWERARILIGYGFRFTAFFAGAPDAALLSRLREVAGELDTLEFIAPLDDAEAAFGELAAVVAGSGTRLQVTPLIPPVPEQSGRAGRHTIRCGFAADPAAINSAMHTFRQFDVSLAAGVALTVEAVDADTLVGLAAWSTESGIGISVLAAWAGDDKDDTRTEADALAAHIERLVPLTSVREADAPRIHLDTFMEFDRSYHPRAGLIDRRANLTTAGKALLRYLAGTNTFRADT